MLLGGRKGHLRCAGGAHQCAAGEIGTHALALRSVTYEAVSKEGLLVVVWRERRGPEKTNSWLHGGYMSPCSQKAKSHREGGFCSQVIDSQG